MIPPPKPCALLLRKTDFAGFCSAHDHADRLARHRQGGLLTPDAPHRRNGGAHAGVVTVEWER